MDTLRLITFYVVIMAPPIVGFLSGYVASRRLGAIRGLLVGLGAMIVAYMVAGIFVANR